MLNKDKKEKKMKKIIFIFIFILGINSYAWEYKEGLNYSRNLKYKFIAMESLDEIGIAILQFNNQESSKILINDNFKKGDIFDIKFYFDDEYYDTLVFTGTGNGVIESDFSKSLKEEMKKSQRMVLSIEHSEGNIVLDYSLMGFTKSLKKMGKIKYKWDFLKK